MEIITYVYYTGKQQRLAIHAKENGDNIEITVLKCSKKDQFTKKFARQALALCEKSDVVRLYGELLHPEKFVIDKREDFRKTFFEWADGQYFKLKLDSLRFNTVELQRGFDRIILNKTFPKKFSCFL